MQFTVGAPALGRAAACSKLSMHLLHVGVPLCPFCIATAMVHHHDLLLMTVSLYMQPRCEYICIFAAVVSFGRMNACRLHFLEYPIWSVAGRPEIARQLQKQMVPSHAWRNDTFCPRLLRRIRMPAWHRQRSIGCKSTRTSAIWCMLM